MLTAQARHQLVDDTLGSYQDDMTERDTSVVDLQLRKALSKCIFTEMVSFTDKVAYIVVFTDSLAEFIGELICVDSHWVVLELVTETSFFAGKMHLLELYPRVDVMVGFWSQYVTDEKVGDHSVHFHETQYYDSDDAVVFNHAGGTRGFFNYKGLRRDMSHSMRLLLTRIATKNSKAWGMDRWRIYLDVILSFCYEVQRIGSERFNGGAGLELSDVAGYTNIHFRTTRACIFCESVISATFAHAYGGKRLDRRGSYSPILRDRTRSPQELLPSSERTGSREDMARIFTLESMTDGRLEYNLADVLSWYFNPSFLTMTSDGSRWCHPFVSCDRMLGGFGTTPISNQMGRRGTMLSFGYYPTCQPEGGVVLLKSLFHIPAPHLESVIASLTIVHGEAVDGVDYELSDADYELEANTFVIPTSGLLNARMQEANIPSKLLSDGRTSYSITSGVQGFILQIAFQQFRRTTLPPSCVIGGFEPSETQTPSPLIGSLIIRSQLVGTLGGGVPIYYSKAEGGIAPVAAVVSQVSPGIPFVPGIGAPLSGAYRQDSLWLNDPLPSTQGTLVSYVEGKSVIGASWGAPGGYSTAIARKLRFVRAAQAGPTRVVEMVRAQAYLTLLFTIHNIIRHPNRVTPLVEGRGAIIGSLHELDDHAQKTEAVLNMVNEVQARTKKGLDFVEASRTALSTHYYSQSATLQLAALIGG